MGDLIKYEEIKVFRKEGDDQSWTDSREVARVFGKNHHDVLRAIQRLDCSEEFRESNFALSSYLTEQNKSQPCYELTRSGFTFLAMGFTGKMAGYFKEQYIKAFDVMEQRLRSIATNTFSSERLESAILLLTEIVNEGREESKLVKTDIKDIQSKVYIIEDDVRYLKTEFGSLKKGRKDIPKSIKSKHLKVIMTIFNGKCPCCMINNIIEDNCKSMNCNFDHWHGSAWNKAKETWPICKDCHDKLTLGLVSRAGEILSSFNHYQRMLSQYDKSEGQLNLWDQNHAISTNTCLPIA